ncbi:MULTISPECIES: SMU1112c/YaeR family gloxylase I-like metalloprotein [Dyella]|uniref:VOC family protein n=2 Tax=Dyella TaxID=231454 RepID=A0A4R0Z394_9GAMM|nr:MULTISPECIES: VOC family protein [Dyella]TBR39608.1 VOC family protein [Dyella terrae]TCI12810.1 VOC family protein [Dyella soli]
MSEPLLAAIHHVALICSDYQRSRHFYSEVLGLRIVREVYREARQSWKCDLEISPGVQLELFSFPSPPPRPSRPEAQGLRHLAFAVPDVDAAVRSLNARGVECEPIRIDEYTGRRFTFFADPDDLPIELYEA